MSVAWLCGGWVVEDMYEVEWIGDKDTMVGGRVLGRKTRGGGGGWSGEGRGRGQNEGGGVKGKEGGGGGGEEMERFTLHQHSERRGL